MFTEGTRQFGIWKVGHPSVSRHTGRPTQAILLAYGFCAFLTWFIFILTLKVRGDFFLVESMHIPLHKVESGVLAPAQATPSSVTLAIRPVENNNSIYVIFDSGQTFAFPEQLDSIEDFLKERVEEIELTAFLKKKMTPGLGVVDLWVDQRVAMSSVQPLANLLVRLGFDTLRYAVQSGEANNSGGH